MNSRVTGSRKCSCGFDGSLDMTKLLSLFLLICCSGLAEKPIQDRNVWWFMLTITFTPDEGSDAEWYRLELTYTDFEGNRRREIRTAEREAVIAVEFSPRPFVIGAMKITGYKTTGSIEYPVVIEQPLGASGVVRHFSQTSGDIHLKETQGASR